MGRMLRMLVVSAVGGWVVKKLSERVGGRSQHERR
jgi:hypothetical protein